MSQEFKQIIAKSIISYDTTRIDYRDRTWEELFQELQRQIREDDGNYYACLVQEYNDAYHSYLESNEWEEIKALRLLKDKCTCQHCQSDNIRILHVHHLTYKNVGNERVGDLITLCKTCHAKVHGKEVKQ